MKLAIGNYPPSFSMLLQGYQLMRKSLTIIITLSITSLLISGCANLNEHLTAQDDSASQSAYDEIFNIIIDDELKTFRQELASRPEVSGVTAPVGHTRKTVEEIDAIYSGTQNPTLIMYIFTQNVDGESKKAQGFATTFTMYEPTQ